MSSKSSIDVAQAILEQARIEQTLRIDCLVSFLYAPLLAGERYKKYRSQPALIRQAVAYSHSRKPVKIALFLAVLTLLFVACISHFFALSPLFYTLLWIAIISSSVVTIALIGHYLRYFLACYERC